MEETKCDENGIIGEDSNWVLAAWEPVESFVPFEELGWEENWLDRNEEWLVDWMEI